MSSIDVANILSPGVTTTIFLTKKQVVKFHTAIDEIMQGVFKAEKEGQEIKGLMLSTVPAAPRIHLDVWREE